MDIRIRRKKDIRDFEEIKEIEKIKCNTKVLSILLNAYRDKIRLENMLMKTKPP